MSGSRVQSAVLKLVQENPEFRESLKAELAKEAATRVRTDVRTTCQFNGTVTPFTEVDKKVVGTLSFWFEGVQGPKNVKVSCVIRGYKVVSCKSSVKDLEALCKAAIQTMVDHDSIG